MLAICHSPKCHNAQCRGAILCSWALTVEANGLGHKNLAQANLIENKFSALCLVLLFLLNLHSNQMQNILQIKSLIIRIQACPY
jgi:hypothetical protein